MNKLDRLKKMVPLTETSFYVLVSLLEPLHGYGIMQKVQKLSQDRIHLGPGTLYGALNNLQNMELISLCESESTSDRRKTYKITHDGEELVRMEIKRLEEMVSNAKMLFTHSQEKSYE
jgi:DNA-binding PadR family transcriptional regulator